MNWQLSVASSCILYQPGPPQPGACLEAARYESLHTLPQLEGKAGNEWRKDFGGDMLACWDGRNLDLIPIGFDFYAASLGEADVTT